MLHVKANPDSEVTNKNTSVNVDVLTNDVLLETEGGDGSVRSETAVLILTQPSNGTAEVLADKTIEYTPDPNFTGVDTFEYRVETFECDSWGLRIRGYESEGEMAYTLYNTWFDQPEDPEDGDVMKVTFTFEGVEFFLDLVYDDDYGQWNLGDYDLPDEDFFDAPTGTRSPYPALFSYEGGRFHKCFSYGTASS